MATVTALQSFVGRLKKDKTAPPKVVKWSMGTDTFPGEVLEPGESIVVQKGQNFDSNHPVVRKFPSMFGEVELVHPPVEQATASPGEKRAK